MTLQSDEGAERIDVGLVTGNYFEVMGLAPVLGRVTEPADDGPGVPPVIVLTHDFWMERFGGDASIVGKQLRLDDNSVAVIGVLEPAPFYRYDVDALLNMVISDHHLSSFMVEGRTHRMKDMVARHRRRACYPGRQQRCDSNPSRNASRQAHRADRSHRQRADHRTDQR